MLKKTENKLLGMISLYFYALLGQIILCGIENGLPMLFKVFVFLLLPSFAYHYLFLRLNACTVCDKTSLRIDKHDLNCSREMRNISLMIGVEHPAVLFISMLLMSVALTCLSLCIFDISFEHSKVYGMSFSIGMVIIGLFLVLTRVFFKKLSMLFIYYYSMFLLLVLPTFLLLMKH